MLEEEADHIDRHDQQEFLAITDYLSNYGLTILILHIQAVATEVLNRKQLRDPFNSTTLGETIMKILDIFMGIHHWVTYLVPKNVVSYKRLKPTSSNNFETLPEISKLDQLMVEAPKSTRPGIPLAKLLPLLAQMSRLLLEEPTTYDVSNLNLDDLKDNVELSSLEFQAKLILKWWVQL
ncbi:hypothetical protein GIB67_007030 [Kingdonia uniflora]|uniref:Uncharacterized protein n=1 Tax=Kingdonia uniflora TaxID=39325 RepID=A0A7J7NZB3_9MAGN|nr:hypothetical protein GIB67_007030 [Kingdonia uniflora]